MTATQLNFPMKKSNLSDRRQSRHQAVDLAGRALSFIMLSVWEMPQIIDNNGEIDTRESIPPPRGLEMQVEPSGIAGLVDCAPRHGRLKTSRSD
ncbi:hypothetical protein [Metarhizobium album]|uniref:hypothetical protein n=1 Tax=Metarhizobium album TaxID=2182425 RepID=UPI000FFEA718|nr:hypothetical protein [Rhizobium album]